MRYNIINRNLLGDGLIATPAIRALASRLSKGDELFMFTQDEPHCYIYGWLPYLSGAYAIDLSKPPEELKIPEETGVWVEGPSTRTILLDIGKAFNSSASTGELYSQGYARQLGVYPLEDTSYDAGVSAQHYEIAREYYDENFAKPDRPVVLVSHVSRSCTSRAGLPRNKMLDESVWRDVVEDLSKDYHIVFMVEKADDIITDIGDCSFIEKAPISICAAWMTMAQMLVTIENGMIILGQAMNANIVGIAGAVPISFYWSGTKGESIILEYTSKSVDVINSQRVIYTIKALSEAINAKVHSKLH